MMALTARMKGPDLLIFPACGKSELFFFKAEAQLHGIGTKLIQRSCRGAAWSDRINSVIESWVEEALMKESPTHPDWLFPVFN